MMGDERKDENGGRQANRVPKGIMAYIRHSEYNGIRHRRLVLLNFKNRSVEAPLFRQGYLYDAVSFQVVLSTDDDRVVASSTVKDGSKDTAAMLTGKTVILRPNEGMVVNVS